MNRVGIFFIAFIGFVQTSFCQQLYMEKTFGGARFETDSLTLSLHQVLVLMQDNPVAYDEFKRAKLKYSASGVFGFAGGLLMAFPLITAVAGGNPEWGLAVAGGAMILVSIPLTRSFYRHAENALENYNVKYQTRIQTDFYLTGAGGKLVIRF